MDTVDQLSASGTAAQSVVDPHAAALQEGNVQQFVAAAPPLPLPDAPFTFENIFELKDVTQLCRKFRTFLCELRFAAFQTPVALLLLGERGVGKRHVARTLADEAKFELVRMVALAEDTLLCRKTGTEMTLSDAFEAGTTMAPGPRVLLVEHVELLSADKLCQEIDYAKESQHFLFIGTSTENSRALQVFANIDESWHFTSGFIGLTDVELNGLTRRTIGFSANQILATVNRAREHAIFNEVPLLFSHFHTALVELISEFKPFWRVPVATERWTVACHEVGRAAMAVLAENATPLPPEFL